MVAMGCAAYLVAAGSGVDPLLLAAILMLSVGQVALLAVLSRRAAVPARQDGRSLRGLRQLTESVQILEERIADLENRPANPPGLLEGVVTEVRSLQHSIAGLLNTAPVKPGPVPVRSEDPVPAALPETAAIEVVPAPQPSQAAEPAAEKSDANERLELMLEPVIELSTGTTSHYRAILCLTDDHGRRFEHAQVLAKADEGGIRDIIDSHALKLLTPVLRRLRLKNPGTRVFLAIGGSTLGSASGLEKLVATLELERDVASGIVFEITQDALAGLDKSGIAGLAQLGRLGATMALSNVAVAGVDLTAPRQLGVKFLCIAAAAFDSGFGVSNAWRDFAQYARAMQFQIVATGIHTAQQATATTSIVRYGCGPFFAPPRRVKTDAGIQGGARHAFAA